MRLKPLKGNIVIKPVTRVKSNIIAVVMDEKDNMGTVVAVGPGHYQENGKFLPQQCKVGDRIRFGTMGQDEYLKYPEYTENGVSYRVLSWQDVCFVDEENV